MRFTITDTDAREQFPELIQHVSDQQDHYVIKRAGQPTAVVVPFDYYVQLQQMAKDRVFDMLEEVWRRTEEAPGDELEADVADALVRLREENLAYTTASPDASREP